MATCKSCSAEIVWCETASGKKMPVDVELSPNGNVEVVARAGQMPRAVVHSQPPFDVELHMPHHATCPHANAHRRPR